MVGGESLRWASAAVCLTAVLLAAQEPGDEAVLMLDLGIIIEPESADSATRADRVAAGNEIKLLLGTAPPGATFIATTKELRSALDELSGQINSLENSLNQDVEAVRLENERLRSLIRKIQTSRSEEQAARAAARLKEQTEPARDVAVSQAPPMEGATYRAALQTYRSGNYAATIRVGEALNFADLTPEQAAQVAYWHGDALFRLGRLDEALSVLEPALSSGDALVDDAIVLAGLIYMRQGKAAAARSRFEAIVSQHPTSAYHRLAVLTIKELKHR